MQLPFFSILIPVYNVEKYLPECLESVVNQTFQDYEAIIIDDGSTDGSGKICDAYARKYPQLRVYHQANRGLMMARKEGIVRARGKYCLFLDSDDLYNRNLLKTVNNYLRKDNLDLLFFNLSLLYKNRIKQKKRESGDFCILSRQNAVKMFMESMGYNSVVTKVIKRELILPHLDHIYVPISYAEDALQTAHFLSLANSVGVLKRKLYYYRMRKSSLVHKKNIEGVLESLYVMKDILGILEKSVSIQSSTKEKFMTIALIYFMEDIFGIKKMGIPLREYTLKLHLLMQDRFVLKLLKSRCSKRVALYHRIRIFLLINQKYTMLFLLDSVLSKIQRFLKFLMNKEYFD